MKILMISFTSLIQELYHGKPREIAKLPGVTLTVLVPPYWKELWSRQKRFLEVRDAETYTIKICDTYFSGNLHLSVFREKIRSLLKKMRPDIIDIEDEPFNLGSAQIILLRNMFSPHSRIVMHVSQSDYKKYPVPFNFIEQYAYRNVSAFLARNEDAVAVLRKKEYTGKVEIVPHGVDPNQFSWTRHDARKSLGWSNDMVVGYIGALAEHKGLDTLLRAAAGLNCKIVFVGDGTYRKEIERLSGQLNLGDRLQMIPPVPHREIPKYLAAMDIFVLPSRTTERWREKFGRVLIEAMASGTPVIGSDSGEIPHVVGDAGIIFHEGASEELANRLSFLLTQPQERRQMAEKGRLRVRNHYSWSIIAQRTYALYREVLGH